MTKGEDIVTPVEVFWGDGSSQIENKGLTKREHFASMAMQGWISATNLENVSMSDAENLPIASANWAVAYADALINALNKTKND